MGWVVEGLAEKQVVDEGTRRVNDKIAGASASLETEMRPCLSALGRPFRRDP